MILERRLVAALEKTGERGIACRCGRHVKRDQEPIGLRLHRHLDDLLDDDLVCRQRYLPQKEGEYGRQPPPAVSREPDHVM
jgi:hypothetical protein